MEEKLNKNQGEVGGGFAEIPDEALLDASGGGTTYKPYPESVYTAAPLWKCCRCGRIVSGLEPPDKCCCGSTCFEYYGVTDKAPITAY